jgi:calcineurin-like phosphoesterase family protein
MINLQAENIWFTSDSHYAHRNICRGISNWGTTDSDGNFEVSIPATRDFPDLMTMNQAIVDRINSEVKEDDWLIHLGDWSFGGQDKIFEFREQINCKNIVLIYGNHDTHIRRNLRGEQKLFKHVADYEELNVKGIGRFVLCHYPIISWNEMRKNTIMLHGHQHLKGDTKFGPGKRMDVGACGNDLWPYSIKDIMEIMDSRPVHDLANDHH